MSNKLAVQISKILIDRQGKHAATQVYVAEPSSGLEKKLGRLMIIARLESNIKKNHKAIEILIDSLNEHYYHRLPTESNAEALEKHFEETLKQANETLNEYIREENFKLDKNKIHLLVAVLKDRQLMVTKHGEAQPFLLHRGKQQTVQMYDIGEGMENRANEESEDVNFQLFADIVSGKLTPGDALFIATSNVLEFISQEKIKTLVYSLPAHSAAEQLKALLAGASINTTFAAIIVRVLANRLNTADIKPASQKSLDGFLATKEETAQVLSPRLKMNFKKYLEQAVELSQSSWQTIKRIKLFNPTKTAVPKHNQNERAEIDERAEMSPREVSKELAQARQQLLSYLRGSRKAGQQLWSKTGRLINRWKYQRTQKTGVKILNTAKEQLSHTTRWYQRLSKKNKYLLIAVIILGLLFTQSLVWLGQGKEQRDLATEHNLNIKNIEMTLSDAEAKIIYEDEARAQELLGQARLLIDDLPSTSRKEANQIDELNKRLAVLQQKLMHVVNIERPEIFTSLTGDTGDIDLMTITDKKLYLYQGQEKKLYAIDLKKNSDPSSISLTDLTSEVTGITALSDSELVLNQADNSFVLYDEPTGTYAAFNAPEHGLGEITDLAIYNERLYVLDAEQDQIWRISRDGADLGSAQAWLKEPGLSISDGVSLAIDGRVFVAENGGLIKQLLGGYRDDLNLVTINPPLEQPTRIWTHVDSLFLYVLEPSKKRLVVYNLDEDNQDKYGTLARQYTGDKFDNLKNFAVLEDEKKILLLNGNTVYTIPAEHLP